MLSLLVPIIFIRDNEYFCDCESVSFLAIDVGDLSAGQAVDFYFKINMGVAHKGDLFIYSFI